MKMSSVCSRPFSSPASNSTSSSSRDEISEEISPVVAVMLEDMEKKFAAIGSTIIGRIDGLGTRIDELEKSVSTLMQQAHLEDRNEPSSPSSSVVSTGSVRGASTAHHSERSRKTRAEI
mmetsp:Transcript_10826/g.15799  ORF Transcript_10826/g.15799 Transcript_10826/m.15799 type:complete len:119 (+) Transcript_10826:105-461(+)